MIRKLIFSALALSFIPLIAQETGEKKLGSWYTYIGTNRVSEKFSVHTEAQFRYFESTGNFNQLLLRTGINYNISPEAMATLGYGFIETDNTFEKLPSDVDLKEHRIYEQFVLKNKVWEILFNHRYRLEQRFLDLGDRQETQHRARYRLLLTLPLTDIFSLNFYDEIFLNLQREVFGQNRLYVGLGINVTENLSFQAGYLKNHFPIGNFDRLVIGVVYNPDLRHIFQKKEP